MGDARMARMMSRMAVSRPPGVSICNTTTRLPLAEAASNALVTYREVAGPIAPLISSTVAVLESVLGAVSVEVTCPEGSDFTRIESGGDAAITTRGLGAITIAARTAMAASDTLKRVRRRTDEAFTPLTLLRSYAGRSNCQSSLPLTTAESQS